MGQKTSKRGLEDLEDEIARVEKEKVRLKQTGGWRWIRFWLVFLLGSGCVLFFLGWQFGLLIMVGGVGLNWAGRRARERKKKRLEKRSLELRRELRELAQKTQEMLERVSPREERGERTTPPPDPGMRPRSAVSSPARSLGDRLLDRLLPDQAFGLICSGCGVNNGFHAKGRGSVPAFVCFECGKKNE